MLLILLGLALYLLSTVLVMWVFHTNSFASPVVKVQADVLARGKKPDGSDVVALNISCIDGVDLAGITMTPLDRRSR